MLHNAYLKAILKERRVIYMQFMKYLLEKFKETKEDYYWEWAMIIGQYSKDTQKDIDKLST